MPRAVRAARPSDIHRLPEQTRPNPHLTPPPPPPEPPRRRLPTWATAVGTVAAMLIVSGALRGAPDPSPEDVPIVDVVTEDQAVTALRLYSAQASAVSNLQAREDIFANPGPADAAAAARQGVAEVQAALTAARSMPDDSLAAVYWNSGEHAVVIDKLNEVYRDARDIALLAATHDSLYGGTGAISLPEAYDQLNNRFSNPRHPELNRWAEALVDQIEQQERMVDAVNFRESVGRMWAEQLGTLRPGAVLPLRRYLGSLPPVTVDNLRGHPVTGPPLQQLEQRSF